MTSLNTILPLEAVKQNKKLQEIKTENYWCFTNKKEWIIDDRTYYVIGNAPDCMLEDYSKFYSAPTLADIIDNAENLFFEDKEETCKKCGRRESQWFSCYESCVYLNKDTLKFVGNVKSKEILEMCQQNKSIDEISKYILENIK